MRQATTSMKGITMKPSNLTFEDLCKIGREEVIKQNSKFAKERLEVKRKEAEAKMIGSVGYASIPPRFANDSFDNYIVVNDKAKKALNAVRTYAENFTEHRKKAGGLIMVGTPGTGKTHLACATCRMVMAQGYQALFTTTLAMIQVVKESYGAGMKTFMEPDLLVIDEIGVQNKTPYELTTLIEILNDRYAQLRPTILLSNLTAQQMRELLDYRVVSRLSSVSTTIPMNWEDFRAR